MCYTMEKANKYVLARHGMVNSSLKPAYHFSPLIGWLNDPNGLCYDGSIYHLFFQFDPFSADGGTKYWAHCTSENMLNWHWKDIALAPDQTYDSQGCWSGTALPENDGLRIMYTGVHMNKEQDMIQEQCLAILGKDGRLTKHPENPVIRQHQLPSGYEAHDFRDPCLFKDADGYGVFVSARGTKDCAILLFRSKDGVNWKYSHKILSGMKAMPECPNVFSLGGTHVLLVSALDMHEEDEEFRGRSPVLYSIGEKFSPESLEIMDKGLDYYAPQTMKTPDGRRVVFAWMRDHHNDSPSRYLGHGWNGVMALPRELSVQNGQLIQRPIQELYDHLHIIREFTVHYVDDVICYLPHNGERLCIQMQISADVMELRLYEDGEEYVSIRYKDRILTLDRSRCGYHTGRDGALEQRTIASTRVEPEKGKLNFEIWLDRGTIELFTDHGTVSMSALAYVKNNRKQISLHTSGRCQVDYVRLFQVDSLPMVIDGAEI